MNERDENGDSDGGRRPASAAGAGPDPDGRTQVISTNRAGPGRPPGSAPPTVHIPPQALPPRAEHGHGRPPAPSGYGSGPGYPPAHTPANPYGPPPGDGNPYGQGSGYGQPAYGAPAGVQPTLAYGAPAGAPTYGQPGPAQSPAQGSGPGLGYPPAYGAAPSYGAPGQPPAGYPAPGAYPGGPSGPPGAVPPPPGFSAAPGKRRRLVTVLVALLAVVALVAGGTIAYFSLRGGGGDTPAEATRLLADDLQEADWSRAFTRMHPDEVALGGDLGTMLHDELVRLEVIKPDADPEATFTGTTFANLQFDDAAVEEVRPDVAIAKLVSGTITVDRDANSELLTDNFKRLAYPGGVPPNRGPRVIDIAQVVAEQGEPVRVATVQVDGDWYVSGTYTLADAALKQNRESWPQGTIAARGSASPQDAVRDAVSALFAQDARRLVELAPPRELAVLHDVGPLLVERAGTPRPTGSLVDIATTPSEVPGGTALTIDRIVVEDTRGNQVTVVRDGDCLSVTQSRSLGGPQRVCADDIARQSAGSVARMTDPALRDIVTRAARAVLDLKVIVVEDGGQYYVSPVRSVVGLSIDVLRTLQPADIARLANAAE